MKKQKTISFKRYSPLTVTAKDTLPSKEVKKIVKKIKKNSVKINKSFYVVDDLAKAAGETVDYYSRKVLEVGSSTLIYGNNAYGTTRQKISYLTRLRWKIRDVVISVRVGIAEKIGGEYLHMYCGDY